MPIAAPSSERALSLWQLQAMSLELPSRSKYLRTVELFYDYCLLNSLAWDTASLVDWIPKEAIKKPGKVLATSTLEQKVTHVNFLTTMKPPLINGGPIHPKRLLQALGKISPKTYTDKVLPLVFLYELSLRLQPTLLQISIQLQTMLGLRAGHFCLLTPCAFMSNSLLLPPFKFQKKPVLICLQHVPTWLIKAFLSFQTSQYAPIIPWSAATYKSKYKKLTKDFNLCKASHSSRHTFASLHAAMGTPNSIIAAYMIHVRETTTKVYVHELRSGEYQYLLQHPDYFLPLMPQFAPASHNVLECYPDNQSLRLKHE